MGKISRAQRRKEYYKIYEQIYESPVQSISDISQNTGISRNTVAKYLQEMYTSGHIKSQLVKIIEDKFGKLHPVPYLSTHKSFQPHSLVDCSCDIPVINWREADKCYR